MNYEDQMNVKELRMEVRRMWNIHDAFDSDLINLPEVCSIQTMQLLIHSSMNWGREKGVDLHYIGNELQRKHGHEVIPYKCEYEVAAGLWHLIRKGLIAETND